MSVQQSATFTFEQCMQLAETVQTGFAGQLASLQDELRALRQAVESAHEESAALKAKLETMMVTSGGEERCACCSHCGPTQQKLARLEGRVSALRSTMAVATQAASHQASLKGTAAPVAGENKKAVAEAAEGAAAVAGAVHEFMGSGSDSDEEEEETENELGPPPNPRYTIQVEEASTAEEFEKVASVSFQASTGVFRPSEGSLVVFVHEADSPEKVHSAIQTLLSISECPLPLRRMYTTAAIAESLAHLALSLPHTSRTDEEDAKLVAMAMANFTSDRAGSGFACRKVLLALVALCSVAPAQDHVLETLENVFQSDPSGAVKEFAVDDMAEVVSSMCACSANKRLAKRCSTVYVKYFHQHMAPLLSKLGNKCGNANELLDAALLLFGACAAATDDMSKELAEPRLGECGKRHQLVMMRTKAKCSMCGAECKKAYCCNKCNFTECRSCFKAGKVPTRLLPLSFCGGNTLNKLLLLIASIHAAVDEHERGGETRLSSVRDLFMQFSIDEQKWKKSFLPQTCSFRGLFAVEKEKNLKKLLGGWLPKFLLHFASKDEALKGPSVQWILHMLGVFTTYTSTRRTMCSLPSFIDGLIAISENEALDRAVFCALLVELTADETLVTPLKSFFVRRPLFLPYVLQRGTHSQKLLLCEILEFVSVSSSSQRVLGDSKVRDFLIEDIPPSSMKEGVCNCIAQIVRDNIANQRLFHTKKMSLFVRTMLMSVGDALHSLFKMLLALNSCFYLADCRVSSIAAAFSDAPQDQQKLVAATFVRLISLILAKQSAAKQQLEKVPRFFETLGKSCTLLQTEEEIKFACRCLDDVAALPEISLPMCAGCVRTLFALPSAALALPEIIRSFFGILLCQEARTGKEKWNFESVVKFWIAIVRKVAEQKGTAAEEVLKTMIQALLSILNMKPSFQWNSKDVFDCIFFLASQDLDDEGCYFCGAFLCRICPTEGDPLPPNFLCESNKSMFERVLLKILKTRGIWRLKGFELIGNVMAHYSTKFELFSVGSDTAFELRCAFENLLVLLEANPEFGQHALQVLPAVAAVVNLREDLRNFFNIQSIVNPLLEISSKAAREENGKLFHCVARVLCHFSEKLREVSRSVAEFQQLSGKKPSDWDRHSTVSNCTGCDKKFTFTHRRHHCRICNGVKCSGCIVRATECSYYCGLLTCKQCIDSVYEQLKEEDKRRRKEEGAKKERDS